MAQEIVRLGGAWHYRLEEKLACSTFGEIWRAQWMQTGKMVALKRLNRDLGMNLSAEEEGLRHESLRRELMIYQRMGENLHFARLLHHGEVDGVLVMILELLDGDLRCLQESKGSPWSVGQAIEWVRQVASGLAWMHSHGLCHLDLKPQNLLYSQRTRDMPPVLKIADFGLALDCSEGPTQHRIPGSPGWMAPEQATPWQEDLRLGNLYRSDARADIYALGLLLFYLLTGEKTTFSVELGEWMKRGNPGDMTGLLTDFEVGLSAVDFERLRAALHCSRLEDCKAGQEINQEVATWLPVAVTGATGPDKLIEVPLLHMLKRMLSSDISHRPQSAGFLLFEIEILLARYLVRG